MTIIIYNEGPFHTSVRSFFPEPSKHFFPPLIEWIMGTSLLTSMVRSCCAIGCETAPRIGQFTWSGSAGLSAGETVFQLAFSIINTHAHTHAPLSKPQHKPVFLHLTGILNQLNQNHFFPHGV